MSSSRLLFFMLIPIILDLVAAATAQIDDGVCTFTADFCWRCSSIGTYTDDSIYQENLNNLLSNFSSNTQINYGFYNSSTGQDPNKVNAIALCRGDITLDMCHTCVKEASQLLFQNCSHQKEAILWAQPCMVRYSSKLIFDIQEDEPIKYVPSPTDAANIEQFTPLLNSLLDTLSEKAASGDSLKKYAAGHTTLQVVPKYQAIYGLVQCTPDMDKNNCSNCLQDAISKIPTCCGGKQGGRVLKPSCSVRFEATLFYESTADSEVSLPPIKGKKGNASKTTMIIIIVAVIAFILTLLVSICIFFRAKKRNLENDNSGEISLADSLQYDFETIRDATDDFSDENKLGQGGFGAVYKGRLANGQDIAVKRLSKNSEQGDQEFKNEVTLVAQLQHRNLVRLRGFCLKMKERILIYEYVPNTSLDHFIFDPINHGHLDWDTRYKIIGGIARGILYLHEDSRLRIIHRDLKPSNILLDGDMNPKIADFGMARLFLMDQTQGHTNRVVGTYGYMAPEYAIHGRFSVKSDVFSFGVLVLEIVSGKKVSTFRNGENEEDLLSYAWRSWKEDTVHNIIDPMLTKSSRIETMRCIHIGLLCVQENLNSRPTMSSVVSMLNSDSVTLSLPLRPGYFLQYNDESDITELTESRNEASITNPYPR
ncbi:cysteine-rich receptor-like protein kinase 44 [Rosa rugosa]|uniref:cysteine-rich receptor-like protein kinase 44 n=1 Tax=Rosa rugosa TaxID=74645 RepID=UPI002B408706|nr:cysteine-rich receptor-like protein kinase 44 [Rosa rugosa]